TRLNMGQELELHRAPVDLIALANERVSLFRQTSRRHEVVVVCEVDEVIGEWDRARLERVVDNLIGNAIKYSPSGGRVTVRIGREGGKGAGAARAVLSVEDEGIGIPEAEQALIFQPYHRAAN